MEASVCNLLSAGDTAIFVNGGKFGERWGEILTAYGVRAVEITKQWGHACDAG
jgi:aspartate aminotransferase-like enzyme